LITVSAETDEEGDSRDARENRSGYFIIRGIMKTLTPTRERHQCGLKQAKVTGNSRVIPFSETTDFERIAAKRYQIPMLRNLTFLEDPS
jgi:hypothetical protein